MGIEQEVVGLSICPQERDLTLEGGRIRRFSGCGAESRLSDGNSEPWCGGDTEMVGYTAGDIPVRILCSALKLLRDLLFTAVFLVRRPVFLLAVSERLDAWLRRDYETKLLGRHTRSNSEF